MKNISCVSTIAAFCLICTILACGPIRSTTTPVGVESPAPTFQLVDQSGQQVSLGDLTSSGPAALVFNRGHR